MTRIKDLYGFNQLETAFGKEKVIGSLADSLKPLTLHQLRTIENIAVGHIKQSNSIPLNPVSDVHSVISAQVIASVRNEVNRRIDTTAAELKESVNIYLTNDEPKISKKFRILRRLRRRISGTRNRYLSRKREWGNDYLGKRYQEVKQMEKVLKSQVDVISSDICLPTNSEADVEYGSYLQKDMKKTIEKSRGRVRWLRSWVLSGMRKIKPSLYMRIMSKIKYKDALFREQNRQEIIEPEHWYLVHSTLLKLCPHDHDLTECPNIRKYLDPSVKDRFTMTVFSLTSPEVIFMSYVKIARKLFHS